MIKKKIKFIPLLWCTFLMACGGSNGASVPVPAPPTPQPAPQPSPPTPSDEDFNTLEYQVDVGLEEMNVIPAYEAGLSGEGVLVAVADTGLNANLSAFNGRVVAIIGSYEKVVDVDTNTKNSTLEVEDRFRDFARSTSDWFWEVDENFQIIALSERFTALTGKPSVLALGRRLDEVGNFKANLDGNERAYGAFSRRVVFRDQLFELEDSNGEAHAFHLNGVPVFDHFSVDFKGFRGAGVDVSKQYKQAEKTKLESAILEKTISELLDRNEQLVRAIERSEMRTTDALSMGPELTDKMSDIMHIAEKIRQSNSSNATKNATKIKKLARDLLNVFENTEDKCA